MGAILVLFNNQITSSKFLRAKAELTIASQKLRVNNVVVLIKTNLCQYKLIINIFFAKNSALSRYSPLFNIYRRIHSEQRSQSDCIICNSILVYLYTVYQCANCKELFADLMLICTHKCQDMRNDDVHEIRLVFTHEVKNIKGKNTE